VDFLAKQRDLYGYLHDQTLRLINQGYTGNEIAELITLPATLEDAWHCRGYYGSVSHNVKAVYQRYMGWFDGNPAHLWEHPPVESAERYVDFMGGSDAVLERARASFADGDFRWVAQVVNHVVFADPDNAAARDLQAAALEQLGYGAENATWRNFFLNGATELRQGVLGTPTSTASGDMLANLTLEQILDSLAIRIDGPRAAGEQIVLNWTVDDERYVTTLTNGVLTYLADKHDDDAVASLTIAHGSLVKLVAGLASPQDLLAAGELKVDGDGASLAALLALLDAPDPNFAIVTP
jgi:alkyl sulfatase BDS1-like metallo-beta-lactamase superfamily hydrolase